MNLKKGIKLIEETEGTGNHVQRHRYYILAIRLTLNKGDVVKVPHQCLSYSIDPHLKVNNDGFLKHRTRIDREYLIPGIFYAVQGMKVKGYRKIIISPHF